MQYFVQAMDRNFHWPTLLSCITPSILDSSLNPNESMTNQPLVKVLLAIAPLAVSFAAFGTIIALTALGFTGVLDISCCGGANLRLESEAKTSTIFEHTSDETL